MDEQTTPPSSRRRRSAEPHDSEGAVGDQAAPGRASADQAARDTAQAGPNPEPASTDRGAGQGQSHEVERGAIGRLEAGDVTVSIGAIGAVRADEVEVELGAVGAALTNELEVSQAAIGNVVAGQARIGQAVVRTLVAREVVIERQSLVGFLLAGRVSGDVRVLLDWRGALAFGLAFGLLASITRRRR